MLQPFPFLSVVRWVTLLIPAFVAPLESSSQDPCGEWAWKQSVFQSSCPVRNTTAAPDTWPPPLGSHCRPVTEGWASFPTGPLYMMLISGKDQRRKAWGVNGSLFYTPSQWRWNWTRGLNTPYHFMLMMGHLEKSHGRTLLQNNWTGAWSLEETAWVKLLYTLQGVCPKVNDTATVLLGLPLSCGLYSTLGLSVRLYALEGNYQEMFTWGHRSQLSLHKV